MASHLATQPWGVRPLNPATWILAALVFFSSVSAAFGQAQTAISRDRALEVARRKGWPVRQVLPDQRVIELQHVINGIPLYYATLNASAADTVSADECQAGGAASLDLTGAGVRLGIWDGGGVRLSHDEFSGRAVQMDGAPFLSGHATHVGGTMAAGGALPSARGMSPAAILAAYDWTEDLEEVELEAALGLRLSNHSYGFLTGWFFNSGSGDWYWYGDATVIGTEDYFFGFYSFSSRNWDELAYQRPHLLFVKAAGNDRNEGPTSGAGHWVIDPVSSNWQWSTSARSLDGNNGYDTLSHQAVSKNGLVVGAVHDIIGGYAVPTDAVMSSFSCWGPCDDGRIKPDLVANGVDLFSASAAGDSQYATLSGTSMATPSVSGSLGLLIEHYRSTHPSVADLQSATLKALVIHTADEAGTAPGPDYRFGWGLLNVLSAAQVISQDAVDEFPISEHVLENSQVVEIIVLAAANEVVRATVAWTDPPGQVPTAQVDPAQPALVNDLDLRIQRISDGQLFLPWTLTGASPVDAAAPGDNTVDNVEQVVVAGASSQTYRIRVSHKGVLSAEQKFGLLITGVTAAFLDCNDNGQADTEDMTLGFSQDCDVNGVPDECDIGSGGASDCNANSIPDRCEFEDCNGNCVPDEQDLLSSQSEDCNADGKPDECDIAEDESTDCNSNSIPDECDLAEAVSADCNANNVPDECDISSDESNDCNSNSVPDECDIAGGTALDCNSNNIPDACDLAGGAADCNSNGVPDECEFTDCNGNCLADSQDLAAGTSEDCNSTNQPDECDIASGHSDDFDANSIPDDCENLGLPGFDAILVAREGRPAPGMGTFTSLLSQSSVNNGKDVVFWADTSGGAAIYLWTAGALELLVRENDVVQGGTMINQLHKEVHLNDQGVISFAAELAGAPTRGLLQSTSSGIDLVVAQGSTVPGFGSIDFGIAVTSVQHGLANNGDLYFRAHLVGAPGGIGESGAILRHAAGSLSVIAASGGEYPEIGQVDAIQQGPWVAADGVVTFRARFEGVERIIRYRAGVMEEVVRTGAYAPGTGSGFTRFDDPVSTAGIVEAFVTGDSYGQPGHGLFKQRLKGDVLALVLDGDPSPVSGGAFLLPRQVAANPLGDVYFYSQVSGTGPASGVFRFDQRRAISNAVLLQGDVAPATSGLAVDDVGSPVLNSSGDMALLYKATDQERRLLLLDQHLLGDLDLDDDVDVADYESFVECMQGPTTVLPSICEETDLDQDGNNDMDDFGLMQDAFVICEQGSTDCNGNGVSDSCEVLGLVATDCDLNDVLDECQIAAGTAADCNANWILDVCDIAEGESLDLNSNGIPDECDNLGDCNYNGVADPFDIADQTSQDCDLNGIPDDCELRDGPMRLIGWVSGQSSSLYAIHPDDPATLDLLSNGVPQMPALAEACDGSIYGIAIDGSLFRIDSESGSVTPLASTSLIDPSGAAYDCRENVLYTTSYPDGLRALHRVSPLDGSVELIGSFGQDIAGLAFDSDDRILYGFTDGLLWTFDLDTGWPTLICDNVLFSQAKDLAFADGRLYTTSAGQLYEVIPLVGSCTTSSLGALPVGIDRADGLSAVFGSTDCNENEVPDNCDISDAFSTDFNGNGIPDECETDCDGNGVDDQDELLVAVELESMLFSPFGDSQAAVYIIPPAPLAVSTVHYLVEADADLGSPVERISYSLSGPGGLINYFPVNFGLDCDPASALLNEQAFNYNSVVRGLPGSFAMIPTAQVSTSECPASSIRVTITYTGTNDCNNNGRLDECDIAFAISADCNLNGMPDECEASRGWSPDCNQNQQLDECEALEDCNNNSVPDECESDCNGNGEPDDCDVAAGASDCDGNTIPDECDPDCNANNIPDACDLSSGSSPDCNDNDIPDECDVAGGSSNDSNTNGVPDECENLQPMVIWGDGGTRLVERIWTDGTHRHTILNAEGVAGITIDAPAQTLYWVEIANSGNLGRVNLDGSGMQLLRSGMGNNLSGVAMDSASARLFVCRTFSDIGGVIWTTNLDGSNLQVWKSGIDEPRGVVVDSVHGKLYWYEQDDTVIRRANLDGTGVETIKTTAEALGGIALDPAADRLYWTHPISGQIKRSSLNGSGEVVLLTVAGWPAGVVVDPVAGKLYWTEDQNNRIQRANLSGSGVENFVVTGFNIPRLISIYNP